jgi:hypothetical protein
VKGEQRQVGIGGRGDVRDRRDAADPGVELAQIQLTRVTVDEVIDLEEPPVALLGEAIAEPGGRAPRGLAMKKVVLPESPYGVWTTRSSPRPRPAASAVSS